ncbi:polymer-forming cytoskeletal protein [Comamonas sp. w2-DMI]|uniref:bactofilin family protein n=1 Tax=Comamonas sp. w2-DMI TaxID=3126391 RepID=UPI0032E50EDC
MTLSMPPVTPPSTVFHFGARPGAQSDAAETQLGGQNAEPSAMRGQTVQDVPLVQRCSELSFRLITERELACVTTRLTSETDFNGVYTSKQSNAGLLVSGIISGEVALAAGSLFHLDCTGRAEMCTVKADAVLIAGNFKGVIFAKKLEIAGGAVVEGKIHYEEIAIQHGAKVRAEHHMPE